MVVQIQIVNLRLEHVRQQPLVKILLVLSTIVQYRNSLFHKEWKIQLKMLWVDSFEYIDKLVYSFLEH